MSHNERDVTYTDKVQYSPNESGKKLKRSPSFGEWSDAGLSKTLTVQPEVKIEPYTDELEQPKSPTTVSEACHEPRELMLSPCQDPKRTQDHAAPAQDPSMKPITEETTIPHLYSGMKRKASATDLRRTDMPVPSPSISDIKKSSIDDFFCEVCQVNCSSSLTLSDHLKGKKHKAKLKWNHENRNSDEGPAESTRCEQCQICCPDKFSLEMHKKGKKHKAKMQGLENKEVDTKKPIRCVLCMVSCMNEDAFQQHLEGKQHVFKVELARRGLQ